MKEYVAWFVDREKQTQGFLKMLSRETEKTIMAIEAPAEMGKTWAIQRMRHECSLQQSSSAHFDFRDRRPWDYLSIVRQARDQMGATHFNLLTQTINESTGVNIQLSSGAGSGGDVDMSIGTHIGQVGDKFQVSDVEVAGRDIIKDNFFYVQADSDTTRRAIEARITDAFFTCLADLAAKEPLIFFFDSYEEVTEEADRWIQAQLLARIRDDQLSNVIVVLAGRELPEFDRSSWRHCLASTGLLPFEREYVTEYIVEKRMLTNLDVDTILKTSGGHPGLLGKMADIASLELEDEDDDWL
jgi:hypothetical protein